MKSDKENKVNQSGKAVNNANQAKYIALSTRCTLCGNITGKKTLLGTQPLPREGDFSLCIHCNMLGEFTEGCKELRVVPKGEFESMKIADPVLTEKIVEICNINETFKLADSGISIYLSRINLILPFADILKKLD